MAGKRPRFCRRDLRIPIGHNHRPSHSRSGIDRQSHGTRGYEEPHRIPAVFVRLAPRLWTLAGFPLTFFLTPKVLREFSWRYQCRTFQGIRQVDDVPCAKANSLPLMAAFRAKYNVSNTWTDQEE